MKRVEAFCRRWEMLPSGGVVLCALSGGRDSMALCHLLMQLAEKQGFQVIAAHYNHHLRPTADRDEAFVVRWCAEKGLELIVGGGDVAAAAREKGLGTEETARAMRYAFLEQAADRVGADRIATAHHLDDNAETVLLHLLRGSGLKGLGGIQPVRGRIVRPLLEISREEIDRYIEENHIPFVEDETNRDTAYIRNRLRHEVLPLLEKTAPGAARRMAGAGSIFREEDAWLDGQAAALLPEEGAAVSRVVLDGTDPVMQRRMVRLLARRLGVELTREQTAAVLALKSGGWLDLPGGVCACCSRKELRFEKLPSAAAPMELTPGKQRWGCFEVEVGGREGDEILCLRKEAVTGVLTVAAWDGAGRLSVDNGSRTIKRLFADRGIPVHRRREHPALLLDGKAIAVFGVAVDAAFLPKEGEPCLTVTLRKEQDA